MALFAGAYAERHAWDTSALDAIAPSLAVGDVEVRVVDQSGRTVWDLASSGAGRLMSGTTMAGTMGGASPGQAVRLPVNVDGSRTSTLLTAPFLPLTISGSRASCATLATPPAVELTDHLIITRRSWTACAPAG
ncbi:MAG TPA: hypothetical protein VFD49_19870 [Candidatus Dormibacteraeota bacterium]|nr:hypothetical protein [Candidatus Dormibacteraeota bacterium]